MERFDATSQTRLTLHCGRRHGLETWIVAIDGRVLATFLSEAQARTRFKQLQAKLAH